MRLRHRFAFARSHCGPRRASPRPWDVVPNDSLPGGGRRPRAGPQPSSDRSDGLRALWSRRLLNYGVVGLAPGAVELQ